MAFEEDDQLETPGEAPAPKAEAPPRILNRTERKHELLRLRVELGMDPRKAAEYLRNTGQATPAYSSQKAAEEYLEALRDYVPISRIGAEFVRDTQVMQIRSAQAGFMAKAAEGDPSAVQTLLSLFAEERYILGVDKALNLGPEPGEKEQTGAPVRVQIEYVNDWRRRGEGEDPPKN